MLNIVQPHQNGHYRLWSILNIICEHKFRSLSHLWPVLYPSFVPQIIPCATNLYNASLLFTK